MQDKITWEPNNNDPHSAENFAAISQWWESCNGKEMAWAQRLIPESGNMHDISWESQKFDEKFIIYTPVIRGITLFWYKHGSEEERSTIPRKLELEPGSKQLYIYPQSQPKIVIRAGISQIAYKLIEVMDPQIVGDTIGENFVFLLRDKQQKLDIKITLSPSSLNQLKSNLPK